MNWLGCWRSQPRLAGNDGGCDSRRPGTVIFSHSSLGTERRAAQTYPTISAAAAKNGGVVMVTFVPGFLSPKVAAWSNSGG